MRQGHSYDVDDEIAELIPAAMAATGGRQSGGVLAAQNQVVQIRVPSSRVFETIGMHPAVVANQGRE
jgi:hypothetical protein